MSKQRGDVDHYVRGLELEMYEAEQALGSAMGYPAEGPEIGGDYSTVCVGEHTIGTLAKEAEGYIFCLKSHGNKMEALAGRMAAHAKMFMQGMLTHKELCKTIEEVERTVREAEQRHG